MATANARSERVAIVTGGGRGLGRAMALGLAREGWRVTVTAARQTDELDAVASERVLALRADVTREDDCARVVAATRDRFGRVDVLVNNAARGMRYVSESFLETPARFQDAAPDAFRMVIDTNVVGPFLMARAALPGMLEAGWGRIINVSISRDTMQRAGFSPYGPSKAALESETAIWAKDLAGTGVTVNAILPGGITATGMVPDDAPQALRARMLEPDVIVPALLWLVSDAADGVTGKRVIANRWPGEGAIEDAGWAA